MFAWNKKSWNADMGQPIMPTLDAKTSGIIAGTKVATKAVWAPIETVQIGQQVLTFDIGLQTVIAITRNVLMANKNNVDTWPMLVPAGALGNRADMEILPDQPVMIESDTAESLTGDPFALIPMALLIGFRGITQPRPSEWIEVIQLHFAQYEIVYANIGTLFFCRAKTDLLSDMGPSEYEVLALDAADDLVVCLMFEGEGRAAPMA
jgi:hypothetical protein